MEKMVTKYVYKQVFSRQNFQAPGSTRIDKFDKTVEAGIGENVSSCLHTTLDKVLSGNSTKR